MLYRPGGHSTAVAFVDPSGHMYPALHTPTHVDTVTPLDDPYVPPTHGPLHAAVVSPVALPKRPAGHGKHTADPTPLH